MRNAIANIPDWHRIVYVVLGVVGLIATGIIAQPSIVPPALHDIIPWMPFVLLLDGSSAAFLPRVQTSAGPGAAPILSPPAKDSGGTIATPLVDGHAISPTLVTPANLPANAGTRPGDPT